MADPFHTLFGLGGVWRPSKHVMFFRFLMYDMTPPPNNDRALCVHRALDARVGAGDSGRQLYILPSRKDIEQIVGQAEGW